MEVVVPSLQRLCEIVFRFVPLSPEKPACPGPQYTGSAMLTSAIACLAGRSGGSWQRQGS